MSMNSLQHNSLQHNSLQWETHNNNSFNIFIRDLSQGVQVNLKWMIEDLDNDMNTKMTKGNNGNKGNGNKGKKQIMKKKDLIIQSQNKLRGDKLIREDLQKIDFLFRNLTDNNIYDNFDILKTDQGKQTYKLKLLCHFISVQRHKKVDYMSHILNLYFNLKYGSDQYLLDSDKYIKLSAKLDKKLGDYDYKTYMMKELSHLLPPLNFWSKGIHKLDEWQKDVISDIRGKKSVLVRAPTSAGKTFIAMATGLIHNKILYVCPAKPVAYQVGANFVKMGYKVHYLVENMGHLSYDSRTNIFIGTPDIIEKYLPKIYCEFDYAVFDEIHNLNESISYEHIIKLIRCNFLALSATIENIDYLNEIFHRIHPHREIKYIEYKKRFINQQRWSYSDSLKKIHPISCLDPLDFRSFHDISFTPNDCIVLYEALEDELDEDIVDQLSPDNYFKTDKLLTLDDTKEYEQFMKDKLKELYDSDPMVINSIISKFKSNLNNNSDLSDIIPFFRECKKKDLLPMLYFHTEERISYEIAMKVYEDLQTAELFNYPHHYDILEKKDELYKKYSDKRGIYSDSIKIKKGTKDAQNEKTEKMNKYDKEQRDKYISDMRVFYERCIDKCQYSEDYEGSSSDSKTRIKNLKKELSVFIANPDFRSQDIFKKHPDYCFSRGEPMSGQEIKNIRREIKNTVGSTIAYENPIFQLLKRGIGLYIASMPDEYNWILQKLMSEKKLGIIISDRTLCLGIDLPIRSVALSGYKEPHYTTSDYLQMSGRAGRRGHDNQGNIIFHGINNYLDLMKGNLPKLVGSDIKVGESYSVINELNKNIKTDHLSWRIDSGTNDISMISIPIKVQRLAWHIRYYKGSLKFLNDMNKIEKKIFMIEEDDRELWFYRYIIKELLVPESVTDLDNYVMIYKKNKISDDQINIVLPNLIKIADIHMAIVNTLDNTFMITKNNSRIIFENLKTLIYKYRGFE